MEQINVPGIPVPTALPSPAGLQERTEQLHAESRELRARLLRVKADYEAGRLSLDEELALVRGIERELIAVGRAAEQA